MAGCGRGRVIAHPATTHFRSPQVKLTTPQRGFDALATWNSAFSLVYDDVAAAPR